MDSHNSLQRISVLHTLPFIHPLLLVGLKRTLYLAKLVQRPHLKLLDTNQTYLRQERLVRQHPHAYMCQGLGHVPSHLMSGVR